MADGRHQRKLRQLRAKIFELRELAHALTGERDRLVVKTKELQSKVDELEKALAATPSD